MYHLELRQFPKKLNRYNLSGQQVGAILIPWVQERIIEMGDQKWSPHAAKLKLYEAPEVALEGTSMARGWRTVERTGLDVTDRVLAEAREAITSGAAGMVAVAEAGAEPGPGAADLVRAAGQPSGDGGAAADPIAFGVQLASLLGDDAHGLLEAWRSVAARSSGLAPSEALALAERELAQRPPGE